MILEWAEYDAGYGDLIDSWLDDFAVKMTGLDSGWNDYWNGVLLDSVNFPGCVDVCRIIQADGMPLAAVSFGYFSGEVTISEIIVAPGQRGNGIGTQILKELVLLSRDLFQAEIIRFCAVVFPDNTASQGAFEKAGFDKQLMPDGTCFQYVYPCGR